jgi:hypothetical protein
VMEEVRTSDRDRLDLNKRMTAEMKTVVIGRDVDRLDLHMGARRGKRQC